MVGKRKSFIMVLG